MNTTTKRVLLTGATGFIGRWAIPALLRRGYEVHAVGRCTPILPSPSGRGAGGEGARRGAAQPLQTNRHSTVPHPNPPPEGEGTGSLIWHACDLFNPADTASVIRSVHPTHLLHFAWYAEHRKFWTSPLNVDWAAASLHLLRAFADAGGHRAMCAGTCAEYDWSHEVCSERETPTRPRTLYGVCKNSLREVAERFAERAGMSFAWGRTFFLFGPDEHPDRFVPSIILPLQSGQSAACRAGSHVRDFLHVADVADAFASVLDSRVTGPVNIASGEARSLGRVAEYLADRLGRRSLLSVGSTPSTPDNPVVLRADISRLRTEVGWVQRFSLTTGLDDVIAHSAASASLSPLLRAVKGFERDAA
ncbi:MAG: NAD(P)-dependent oxidoreductase [Planctomycetales bacterium]|nr:NAD(P)-dependent oxidoreductase [Planctomycetales bacterium]